jgi:hypothetical protein
MRLSTRPGRAHFWCWALVANSIGACFGTTLTDLDETVEVMMHAQGVTSTLPGLLPANLQPSTLMFLSNVDAEARTFAYSTVPGSTFQGSDIILTGVRVFDAGSQTWVVTSDLTWATTTWSGSGSFSVIGDPIILCEWASNLNIPALPGVGAACSAEVISDPLAATARSNGVIRFRIGNIQFGVNFSGSLDT